MSSLPLGIHNAVCVGVVYIGTQKSIYGCSNKVVLIWEVFVNNQIKIQTREYTDSLKEGANLRLHLESWRGRPFTKDELSDFKLRNVLGVPCKLEIRKNSKEAKQVEKIYRFPKNEEVPISKTEYIFFDVDDKATYDVLDRIPPYIIKRIMQSPEYTGR